MEKGNPPGPPQWTGKRRVSCGSPWGLLPVSHSFSALCIARPEHSAPVPSCLPVRDNATKQLGHMEQRGDEEKGNNFSPNQPVLGAAKAPAAPPPWTLQALGIHGGGSSSRIQPTLPSQLNLCLLFSGLPLLLTDSLSSKQFLASPSALSARGRGDAGGSSPLPSQLGQQ